MEIFWCVTTRNDKIAIFGSMKLSLKKELGWVRWNFENLGGINKVNILSSQKRKVLSDLL